MLRMPVQSRVGRSFGMRSVPGQAWSCMPVAAHEMPCAWVVLRALPHCTAVLRHHDRPHFVMVRVRQVLTPLPKFDASIDCPQVLRAAVITAIVTGSLTLRGCGLDIIPVACGAILSLHAPLVPKCVQRNKVFPSALSCWNQVS